MCCGMSERIKEKADAVMDEISSDEVWQRNHQKKAKNCIEI